MPKGKWKRNKAIGRRYKVLISREWPRKTLPKRMEGILVYKQTFTITKEWKFTVDKLNELVAKGDLKRLPQKKKKKNKAKAAR